MDRPDVAEHLTDAPPRPDPGAPDEPGPWGVVLLDAALALVAAPLLWWLGSVGGDGSWPVAVVVLGLFVVAEWFPIDIELRDQSHTFAFTAVPLIIGLYTLPPLLVIGLRVGASLLVLAGVHRQGPLKLATNLLSHGLQAGAAAAVAVTLLEADPTGPRGWLVVAAAVAASELTGTLVVTAAITISEGGFEREFLDGSLTGWIALVPDVALGLITAILLDVQPAAAALAFGVGLSIVLVLRAHAQVTTRYRSLEALDGFTSELGTAVVEGHLHQTLLAQVRERTHAGVAWIEVPGVEPRRLVLAGADPVLVEEPLPRAVAGQRPAAERGAVRLSAAGPGAGAGAAGEITEIVGAVRVGPDRLLVGVAQRRGEVRAFDDEDVRLFELLVSHAGVALQNVRLVDQLRAEARTNEALATLDQLTGLPNRTLFMRRVDDALADRAAGGPDVGVLLLGLDRFKEVNDTLGHQAGDELLVAVGRRLAATVAAPASVARIGGDEIGVVWVAADRDAIVERSRALVEVVEGVYGVAGVELDVSCSGGLAVAEDGALDALTMLRRADIAMYHAKQMRTPLEPYRPELDTSSPAKLSLAGRLRAAIEARELTLHFQPQVDLRTLAVVGAEALVRWTPAGGRPIPPAEFVEVAERTGLIRPLTRYVLHEAVRQAAAWQAAGTPIRVSANLSPRDLGDDLVDHLAGLLAAHDLDPMLLEVEVTETTVMTDPAAAIATLERIHDLDVSIAVDDFGTGHSSLAYLTRLPVDQLKIDRSFVLALATDDSAEAVIRTIVDLGRNLGLEIVAEGVETAAHVEVLQSLGCGVAQGYHYARPLPADAFGQWYAAHQAQTVPGQLQRWLERGATPAGPPRP